MTRADAECERGFSEMNERFDVGIASVFWRYSSGGFYRFWLRVRQDLERGVWVFATRDLRAGPDRRVGTLPMKRGGL